MLSLYTKYIEHSFQQEIIFACLKKCLLIYNVYNNCPTFTWLEAYRIFYAGTIYVKKEQEHVHRINYYRMILEGDILSM